MYRQYEDPHKLQEELDKELERIHQDGYEPDEFDYERIQELKERINFAWQDEEYDENYARENGEYGDF